MVSAAYYGHIRPTDHEFRLEHQTAHESFAEAYYRLRFGVGINSLIVYLNDIQLAEVASAINNELISRLATKGVEFVEPPLLKVLAAAANYQEDATNDTEF